MSFAQKNNLEKFSNFSIFFYENKPNLTKTNLIENFWSWKKYSLSGGSAPRTPRFAIVKSKNVFEWVKNYKNSLSGGSATRTPRFAIVKSKNVLEWVKNYKKTIKNVKKKPQSPKIF